MSGYQVQISTSKSFKSGNSSYTVKSTSKSIPKLKSNKKYYVRVRAYKTVNGKKQYGKWSTVKNVKCK